MFGHEDELREEIERLERRNMRLRKSWIFLAEEWPHFIRFLSNIPQYCPPSEKCSLEICNGKDVRATFYFQDDEELFRFAMLMFQVGMRMRP